MPKTKWGGADEPTINNFYKIDNKTFEYAIQSAERLEPTSLFHINQSRQKYSLATIVLGDSYGPQAETHANWKKNN